MLIHQFTWPDFTPLLDLPAVKLAAEMEEVDSPDETDALFRVRLSNPLENIAFFVRVELRHPGTEEEILPGRYSANFVTVYPNETVEVEATIARTLLAGEVPELYVEGVNLA